VEVTERDGCNTAIVTSHT